MIVVFEKKYLAELYERGKTSDKKYRFQPQVISKYIRCIDVLISAKNTEALYKLHSLNYEVLKGDKNGVSSVRVDNKYRIEFTLTQTEHNQDILTVCCVIELSNHYK